MKTSSIIILFLLFVMPVALIAENKLYLGPTVYYNSIYNESAIPLYPKSTDCGLYQSGNSSSLSFGLNAGYIIYPNFLEFDTKVLYDVRPLDFQYTNRTGLKVFVDNTYQELVLKHNLEASIKYLLLDLGVKYYPIKNIPIGVRGGFDISTEMFGNNYTNTETIDSPNGILFPDETRSHTIESGKMNINSTNYGLNLSIFGRYNRDSSFAIIPEITYRYQLNSTLADNEWSSNMLKVGLSAVWFLNLEKDIHSEQISNFTKDEQVIVEDTIRPIVYKNITINNINYLETTVTQTYPLLPYIFFDSASVDIPIKFVDKTNYKGEEYLPKNNISIYYQLLNIIGDRLSKDTSNTLIIKGVTDGREVIDSTDKIELARNRAMSVKNYLIQRWNINPKQIITKYQQLPDKISSTEYSEGYAENRRVELLSNNQSLFRPVIHEQYSEVLLKSKDLYFELEIENSDAAKNIEVELYNGKNLIYSNSSNKVQSKFIHYISDVSSLLSSYGQYSIRVLTRDRLSNIYDTTFVLPVTLKQNDFELARLNLIVFDFDSDKINETNQEYLDSFLSSQISNNAEIDITGSTDLLGGYEYNQELSQRRADAVRKIVQKYTTESQIKSCLGLGSDNIKFDIKTPEGRFYCRTVLIEVANPIDK